MFPNLDVKLQEWVGGGISHNVGGWFWNWLVIIVKTFMMKTEKQTGANLDFGQFSYDWEKPCQWIMATDFQLLKQPEVSSN